MKKVIFLRHGEQLSKFENQNDVYLQDDSNGLTEKGKSQIESISKHLKSHFSNFDIFSSPIRRVKESADILSTTLNTEVNYIKELGERKLSNGSITNLDYRKRQYSDFDSTFNVLEGESILEHYMTVGKWFSNFLNKQIEAETTIIVAHGTVIEYLNATLLGQAPSSIKNSWIYCNNGSYNLWLIDQKENKSILLGSNLSSESTPLNLGLTELLNNEQISFSTDEIKEFDKLNQELTEKGVSNSSVNKIVSHGTYYVR